MNSDSRFTALATQLTRHFGCAAVTLVLGIGAARAAAAPVGTDTAAGAPAAGAAAEGAGSRTNVRPPTTAPTTRRRYVVEYRPRVEQSSPRRDHGLPRAAQPTGEIDPPRVYVLSPAASLGTTTREQPTLFWYISVPTKRKVQLSLTPMDNPGGGGARFQKPLLLVTLPGVEIDGVQAWDLSDPKATGGANVKLEKGTRYRWVVTVVASESERAANPYGGCMIMRVEAPATVKAAASGGSLQAAAAYAQAGIWYDALAAIRADPDDASLKEAWRDLLASQALIEDENGKLVDKAQEK